MSWRSKASDQPQSSKNVNSSICMRSVLDAIQETCTCWLYREEVCKVGVPERSAQHSHANRPAHRCCLLSAKCVLRHNTKLSFSLPSFVGFGALTRTHVLSAMSSVEELSALTVVDLKARLTALSLPTTGKKADLVTRLHVRSFIEPNLDPAAHCTLSRTGASVRIFRCSGQDCRCSGGARMSFRQFEIRNDFPRSHRKPPARPPQRPSDGDAKLVLYPHYFLSFDGKCNTLSFH
jgi:hypothetical protein